MKNVLRLMSLFLFVSCGILAEEGHGYDPLLVVVIMVKNEEDVMRDTLQPFVDGGINSFFVLDTGSTDNTVGVTHDFFAEHGIERAYIEQEMFIDFATSRNRALDLAQEKFPNAAFMVMIDAEWYLNDARGLLDFCELCLARGDRYASYLMHIVNESLDNYTCRLLRCNYGVRFGGVVHETIIQQTNARVPADIFFEYLPSDAGVEKTLARFVRDRDLLYKEYLNNPRDTRTLFYLARTCEDLGDLEAAYAFYKERVDMIGWDEEDFIVHHRLAETIKKMVLKKYPKRYQWDESLAYYIKAFQMRPHRIEPLVGIADYYVAIDQMDLAYLFARRAAEIEYPVNDKLFVDKYVYNYYRYELLARCAWYIGEFEVGEYGAQMAYDAYPDYDIAQFNKNVYEERRMIVA